MRTTEALCVKPPNRKDQVSWCPKADMALAFCAALEDECAGTSQTGINLKKGIRRCYTSSLHKALQLWVDFVSNKLGLVKVYAINLKLKVDIASEGSIQEALQ
jgi:hypothetical protein